RSPPSRTASAATGGGIECLPVPRRGRIRIRKTTSVSRAAGGARARPSGPMLGSPSTQEVQASGLSLPRGRRRDAGFLEGLLKFRASSLRSFEFSLELRDSCRGLFQLDRKSTRLNSSHEWI